MLQNLYHSVNLTCGKLCLLPKTERDYLVQWKQAV